MYDLRPFTWQVILSAILMSGIQSCQKEVSEPLSYTISKSTIDAVPALEVRVGFRPQESGITHLSYADNAWGQDSLWNVIRDVRLSSDSGSVEIQRDSGWIVIMHDPGIDHLELSYKVVQDVPENSGPDKSYRPIVQPDYFHAFAHNLLMVPKHYEAFGSARIELHWRGWAPEETIHNSFGSLQADQDLGVMDLEKFMSAIYVGGDYRILSETLGDSGLFLAIRGEWVPFQDDEVMDVLTQTVRAQRDFWDDHSQAYFTVTMRPVRQDRGSSFQGTGLTNSFATSVSNNLETELNQLVYLFNHELMHNWIGHTIENESEEAEYWFSEGFTEYYTAKNIASNRVAGNDWHYYIDFVNATIRNLEASPVRRAPNSEINYENFWSSADYSKLPYYRGFLFAFYLDQQIRAVSGNSQSLDNLMRDLLEDAVREGTRLNASHFIARANAYLPEDIRPFFDQHIIAGQPLPLAGLFQDMGLEFQLGADLYDLGFEFNAGRDSITVVDSASVAFLSGIRPGDRVISRSIYTGAVDKEVELVLERNGLRIPVQYYPVKTAPIPQLVNSASNRAIFGG